MFSIPLSFPCLAGVVRVVRPVRFVAVLVLRVVLATLSSFGKGSAVKRLL
jgi:hypothetical protein